MVGLTEAKTQSAYNAPIRPLLLIMLRKLIDTPKSYNALVRAKHGYMLYNKNDIYIGRSIGKYGEFSEGEVDLFRQLLLPGDVVIEVGANIGAHTLALATLVGTSGRVHAFEPQRIIYQTLVANVALNGIEHVECHRAAAGDASGELGMPDFVYSVEGNFGGIELSRYPGPNKVPVVRLDSHLEIPTGRTLRLIKVDVEGMEHAVLAGADALIRAHQPFLYVENDRIEKSAALITQIERLGYRLYWHTPPMYNMHNYAGDAENLFPNVVSINMLCIPKGNTMQVNGFLPVENADSHPFKTAK
jgi:FkbM family methyltransferase